MSRGSRPRNASCSTALIAGTALAVLALTACRPPPPQIPEDEKTEPPVVQVLDREPDDQAQADLAVAVAAWDAAKLDGQLDPNECRTLASAFERVTREHKYWRIPVAAFDQAVILEECGDTAAARAIYERLSKGGYPLAMNALGVLELQEGRSERAMDLFQRAVDSRVSFAARNNLAAMHGDRYAQAATPDPEDFRQAESLIQNVLAVDTSNRDAYENLARLYYDRGRRADPEFLVLARLVIEQGQRVLAPLGRESAELHNLRGLLHAQTGAEVEAHRSFRRALKLDPDHVDANLNLAFIALRFRDFDLAHETLTRALDVPGRQGVGDAMRPEVALALGVAKRGRSDLTGARREFERAAKLAPHDPRPHYNLGVLEHEHVAAGVEEIPQMKAAYRRALDHYEDYIRLASNAPSHRSREARRARSEELDLAKGRVLVVREALGIIDQQQVTKDRIDELRRIEAEREAAENARLLELEREALERQSLDVSG